MRTDLYNLYKFCRTKVVTASFVWFLSDVLQTNSVQLEPDDTMFYYVKISYRCYGYLRIINCWKWQGRGHRLMACFGGPTTTTDATLTVKFLHQSRGLSSARRKKWNCHSSKQVYKSFTNLPKFNSWSHENRRGYLSAMVTITFLYNRKYLLFMCRRWKLFVW